MLYENKNNPSTSAYIYLSLYIHAISTNKFEAYKQKSTQTPY